MVKTDKLYIFTQAFFLLSLIALLKLGLLPALLSGLLVYHLVEFGAGKLAQRGIIPRTGKLILLFLVASVVISSFAIGIAALAAQVSAGPESIFALLQKMADVVATGRNHLPVWMHDSLPANLENMQAATSEWLRENAQSLRTIGKDTVFLIGRIIIGMIIGGMIAINPAFFDAGAPLAQAVGDRVTFLGKAFRRIVFSQAQISALNTILTSVFLVAILPFFLGSMLPLTKTMIAVTFIAGLLPIVGNLISNTVIFMVGLSVSPLAAIGTLAYLIFIHKLEYFINARIIGSQIRARAWELLLAMLIMETTFGLVGLVAAPIYYAYIKDELSSRKLI